MTTSTIDLTDVVRRAYADADTAGQSRPGRPALMALTGATERQVRRAMTEAAGHLAVAPSPRIEVVVPSAVHPDVQPPSPAQADDVQVSSDPTSTVQGNDTGHADAVELDMVDAVVSSVVDTVPSSGMSSVQAVDVQPSSEVSTALTAQVNELDTTLSPIVVASSDTAEDSAATNGLDVQVQRRLQDAASAATLDIPVGAARHVAAQPPSLLGTAGQDAPTGFTRRVRKLAAHAAEARQLRALHVQPDIRAVLLMRQRRNWTLFASLALFGALASTAVNVQRFASGDAPLWTVPWLAGWLVDPAFSVLLVGILVARGNLSAVRHKVTDAMVLLVEYGLLAAVLVMNVTPEMEAARVDAGQVVLHALLPLLGFGAASVITRIQDRFAAAIDDLYRVGER